MPLRAAGFESSFTRIVWACNALGGDNRDKETYQKILILLCHQRYHHQSRQQHDLGGKPSDCDYFANDRESADTDNNKRASGRKIHFLLPSLTSSQSACPAAL